MESTGQAVAQYAKTNCEGCLYIIFAIGQGVATVKSCEAKGFLLNIKTALYCTTGVVGIQPSLWVIA
jgi:hypothetical protein